MVASSALPMVFESLVMIHYQWCPFSSTKLAVEVAGWNVPAPLSMNLTAAIFVYPLLSIWYVFDEVWARFCRLDLNLEVILIVVTSVRVGNQEEVFKIHIASVNPWVAVVEDWFVFTISFGKIMSQVPDPGGSVVIQARLDLCATFP